MAKSTSHVVMRNGDLFCSNCGKDFKLQMPMSPSMFSAITNQFSKEHASCPKTWTEPVPSPEKQVNSEAIAKNVNWWIKNGERGISSETMLKYTYGLDIAQYECHPCDPADFKRCHLLLQAVPQLRNYLHRMNDVSPVWANLVANWDKLTEMLEEQMRTKKPNGMYEFMRSLGC